MICNKSDRCCMFVHRDKLQCITADISWMSDIMRILFKGKDVCWYLSQIIPGILHESDPNNQVMLYSLLIYSCFIDSQKGYFSLFMMSKCTNPDINDSGCLHIVHNLKHSTSHPTTKSTPTTMVNAPKKNISPLPAANYGKSTLRSTQWRHQTNEGKNDLIVERVRALGAWHSLRSKMKLVAEKRRETHFSRNEEKEQ